MTEPIRSLEWHPRADPTFRERSFRQDPGRIVLLVAVALLVLGAFLPWAEGRGPVGEPVEYTAQYDLADGFVLLLLALILAVLAYGRALVESRTRTVQLVPLALALVAAAMWLGAHRASLKYIDTWTNGGGFGYQTAMPSVTAVGIGLIVVGTVWLEFTRPANVRATTTGLLTEWRVSRVAMAEGLTAGALGVVFAIVGAALVIFAFGLNGSIFAVFVALFGMAAGISIGRGIVRWTRGGAERAEPDSGGAAPDRAKEKISTSRVVRRGP